MQIAQLSPLSRQTTAVSAVSWRFHPKARAIIRASTHRRRPRPAMPRCPASANRAGRGLRRTVCPEAGRRSATRLAEPRGTRRMSLVCINLLESDCVPPAVNPAVSRQVCRRVRRCPESPTIGTGAAVAALAPAILPWRWQSDCIAPQIASKSPQSHGYLMIYRQNDCKSVRGAPCR